MYLTRFVKWLEEIEKQPKDHPKAKVDLTEIAKKDAARRNNKIPNSESSSPELKEEVTTTTSSSSATMENMVKELTQVVAHLAQEVQTLKDEKSEKPRKIVARDDEMEPSKDRG